ncbi:hypothetical protein LINGRAHAP2_LOCUS22749 [Linum grandiflorum]
MAPFDFKSSNHFVASSDGTTLQVHELTANHMVHPFSIRKAHWKQVANINMTSLEEQISYDGLLFFDGHGRTEGSKALTVLAKHPKGLRLLVNPEGYCFEESMEFADYADFGIHYVRLNDLFSWPHHRVNLATTSVWSRSELKYQVPKPKRTTTADHDRHHQGVNYLQKKKITREKNDEITNITKDLEQCAKSSWAISPSVRYLPMGSEGERLHLSRRRKVPPETFIYSEKPYDFLSSNIPRMEPHLYVPNGVQFVDEESSGWPSPTSFHVVIGKNNRGFDKNNWWFAKTNHPEGGMTMLAYYDGNFSQLITSGPSRTIRLPFLKDATLVPVKPFFLIDIHSFGVKLAFMYRV